MFVKVCGITNQEDAEAAIEYGATALGFNFYRKSSRYADPANLRWLADMPPNIWKVGVFVNEDPAYMRRLIAQLKLDIVQLHGDEQPADCPRDLRVWKAIRVDYAFDASRLRKYPVEAILLDGPAGRAYGGSGLTFDWTVAAGLPVKVVVSGGLHAGNVRTAIECIRPWGVDVCSRIESSPGHKDHGSMAEFLRVALKKELVKHD
jgi:phosphoribosylanthranilate isomerase